MSADSTSSRLPFYSAEIKVNLDTIESELKKTRTNNTKLAEATFGPDDCVWEFSIYLTTNDKIQRCIRKANQTKVKYFVMHQITNFSNPDESIRVGRNYYSSYLTHLYSQVLKKYSMISIRIPFLVRIWI